MQIANPLMVAHLARENAENLPHLATIETAITSPTAGGRSVVTSWAPTANNVPCRLAQASDSDQEQLIAAQLTTQMAYTVAFKAGVNVQRKDRLTVTGTTQTPAGPVAFSHVLQVIEVF